MTFSDSAGPAVPYILLALIASAIVSFVLTPLVRRISVRFDAIDHPEHRRVNTLPVPRGGGVAVAVAFVGVTAALLVLNEATHFVLVPTNVQLIDVIGLLLGGLLATAFGVLDDALDLRARWQFAGQLGLAAFAIATGFLVEFIANPLGTGQLRFPVWLAVAFSIVWIAGMINSINFIDGLDGLSTGIGLIAAVTLGVISLTDKFSQPYIAVLCFALAGSLLGFLRWNFHPATIFAGTSGVMFLGYTLALLSILGTAKVPVAILVLGVPIIDAFWNIVRRLAQGRSPFSPDRGHLHHRLLDVGLSHRQTVVLIYVICFGLAVLALLLTGATQIFAFAAVFAASGLALVFLSRERDAADRPATPMVATMRPAATTGPGADTRPAPETPPEAATRPVADAAPVAEARPLVEARTAREPRPTPDVRPAPDPRD